MFYDREPKQRAQKKPSSLTTQRSSTTKDNYGAEYEAFRNRPQPRVNIDILQMMRETEQAVSTQVASEPPMQMRERKEWKDTGNGVGEAKQYASSPVVQRVGTEETGNLVGHTGTGTSATLYFEKGRITQQHDEKDNEGWHPIKEPDKHQRKNIDTKAHEDYTTNRKNLSVEYKQNFAKEVREGKHAPKEGDEGKLFETTEYTSSQSGEQKYRNHPSRSTFKTGIPEGMTQDDIDEVREKALLAKNELKT